MEKIKVAIVGRPNVGKSALFNRICKKRLSIVDEEEGVTRDRLYAEADFFGHSFTLIDTAGISGDSADLFYEEMLKQTKIAIEEANYFIMVVDAHVGITKYDQAVVKLLYRTNKKLVVAVNKIDDLSQKQLLDNFYALGVDNLIGISALSGYNVAELLETLFEDSPWEEEILSSDIEEAFIATKEEAFEDLQQIDEFLIQEEEAFEDFFETNRVENTAERSPNEENSTKIAIIGRANVGKSTLLNYLLKEQRAVVSPIAGTTRDNIDAELMIADEKYLLIDTAGIRKKHKENTVVEKFAYIRTKEAISRCDICLFLSDVEEGMTAQDKKILSFIEEEGKSCLLLFNKWDKVKGFRKEHCLRSVQAEAPFFQHCPTLFISALQKKGLETLFPLIRKVVTERNKKITTGQLNRFMEECIRKNHPPMMMGGKRLRIYYLTQVRTAPPSFVFFVNNPTLLADTYKKFLHNQFRKVFGFDGTPIRFFIRGKSSLEKKQRQLAEGRKQEKVFA